VSGTGEDASASPQEQAKEGTDESYATAKLRADVARQQMRLAKDQLKRARKRFKEARREAKRARKLADVARRAWKRSKKRTGKQNGKAALAPKAPKAPPMKRKAALRGRKRMGSAPAPAGSRSR
jgi:hypothetical protein